LAADIDRHVVDAADAGAGVVDDIGHRGGGDSPGDEAKSGELNCPLAFEANAVLELDTSPRGQL
jgi:hypothetical protein